MSQAARSCPVPQAAERISYPGLFGVFFRIGLITLGGGFAMAPILRHELVLKRKWITERDFIGTLSTATAVPGAIAVNLAFLEGRRMRGLLGGIVAAVGTMCPSISIILLISWFALPYFNHPQVVAFLKGCAIAVAGQIAFAALAFARKLRLRWQNIAVCGAGVLLVALGVHPVWAISATAVLGWLLMRERMMRDDTPNVGDMGEADEQQP